MCRCLFFFPFTLRRPLMPCMHGDALLWFFFCCCFILFFFLWMCVFLLLSIFISFYLLCFSLFLSTYIYISIGQFIRTDQMRFHTYFHVCHDQIIRYEVTILIMAVCSRAFNLTHLFGARLFLKRCMSLCESGYVMCVRTPLGAFDS